MLAGCHQDTAKNNTDNTVYSQVVGPAGGTITDPRGLTLIIPAGALSADTEIKVITLSDTADFASRFPFLAGVRFGAVFEPDGLVFNIPVTMQIRPARSLPVGAYPNLGYIYMW